DQPVVGDWDGDGKDDVGIFGRKWRGDERALAAETGLPDPENLVRLKPKNVPPSIDEAPDDPRLMKRSSAAAGRADLIDHVFKFGGGEDIAVSGDFNGDGISSIGTYREGLWILDVDGDGKLIEGRDHQAIFGQPGDIPIVGDFDGDGIDEIAVVRGDRVLVDTNGNGQFDATDQVFLLDSDNGTVIVGDFDGDGRDEPVLHQSAQQRSKLISTTE
ncbi:MAG: VCBS repeat-containing protein, partial [Planctomycetota bacterium]